MFATRLQNNTGFPTHAASPIPGSEHISQGFFVFSRFLKALLIQEEKKNNTQKEFLHLILSKENTGEGSSESV